MLKDKLVRKSYSPGQWERVRAWVVENYWRAEYEADETGELPQRILARVAEYCGDRRYDSGYTPLSGLRPSQDQIQEIAIANGLADRE